jgi:cellobiose transport system substrate-binding protein
MKWTRTKTASALALGTASALLLSACQSGGDDTPTTSAPEEPAAPVTLTVAYWGNFGLENLVAQYEADHPNVTIELNSGDFAAQHDALQQAIIAGSGAPQIAAIDEGYITGFVAQSDSFVNLLDLGAGKYEANYLPWKWAQAANADGSVVIGLGSDVGGLALCYRRDLFEAAGLPTDRAELAELVGDSWDDFIELGKQYKAATGKAFVDNATNILIPAQTQLGTGYAWFNRNNELDMEASKPAFDTALAVIEAGISANIAPWSPEWNTGFANGDFAVLACPAWMMGYIQGQISADTFAGQWDVTDIPGPGGNWGGSFYTIPKQGDEATQRAAYEFIEWLIQGEQQIAIFQEVGNLPSQSSLYSDAGIQDFTSEFFNGAPVGQIFTKTAEDIPAAIYYAPNNSKVSPAVQNVLNEVQAGNVAIADAWTTAIAAAEAAAAS